MNDAAGTVLEEDPFALVSAEKPGCKFARVIDGGLGVEFVIAFAPGSRYFDMVQDRQTMNISRTAAQPSIDDLKRTRTA
ncbi:MAG TPA: hypothetical protein VE008_07190 [Burkholderiales bacterium]|nr:hypothetical protein [Burkholderiales bacterium]